MKRFFLFLILVSFSTFMYSQTQTLKKVVRKSKAEITQVIDLDAGADDHHFIITAQNSKYRDMIDIFPIISGSAQEIYDFLSELKEFEEKSKGVNNASKEIEGLRVSLVRMSLFGTIIGVKNGGKEHDFKPKDIDFLIDRFKKFCDKNSIELDI